MVGLSAATKCNKKLTSCHEFAKKWLNLKVFLFFGFAETEIKHFSMTHSTFVPYDVFL